MTSYRTTYIENLTEALREKSNIVALWEAGAAATGTTDQYSDIDLVALCSCEIDQAFDLMESVIPTVTHRYIEPAGSALRHRIYFHDGAPKHFTADIGILAEACRETFEELMVIERHGKPVVLIDRKGLIRPHPLNKIEWQAKLENRIKELEGAFPIYKMQVLKPLDRHQNTEAFAFYYHGLLRRLVELLGIRFRPYRYDFELRYLERDFPQNVQESIHEYMKYVGPEDLRKKVKLIEQDFAESLAVLKSQGIRLT